MTGVTLPADPGPWGDYTQVEVVALIAPLIPGMTLENMAAYVIVTRSTDGVIGIARSTPGASATIALLSEAITSIVESLEVSG